MAVVLVGAGAWSYHAVELSIRGIRAGTLRTLVDTHAAALRAAIDDVPREIDPAQRRERVRDAAARYAGAAARWGETGELYVFDRSGGILHPGHSGETTPLGGQAGALEGSGMILEPYPNARGVEVIAAWHWLPAERLGVAMEISADEAYAPLGYVRAAYAVGFGALVAAVLLAVVSGFSALRFRDQLRKGRRVGAYVLEQPIGEGGMASVYRARHDLLKRPTAIKLLKPARATDEMIARFEREVQLASRLSHPNTVEIYDYGRTRDGLFYYAMEYLDGITLAELVQRKTRVPVPRAIHILRQACAGLAEAHAHGLVHRDVKPENLMICRRGGAYDVVKILDFGLVKHVGGEHSRDLTRALRILGTPLYMSPERLRDPADVDARADIYAIGAVAYYMLSGRRLFEAADDLALTTLILNDEAPRLANTAGQPIPPELDLMVAACLEKRREDRPQRIGDLVVALDALAGEHRWSEAEAAAWWQQVPPAA